MSIQERCEIIFTGMREGRNLIEMLEYRNKNWQNNSKGKSDLSLDFLFLESIILRI
jgi:hypothetical protein